MLLIADFAATSAASVLANFVTHPAETIKTRQQLHNSSAIQIIREARASGKLVSSLYRGFGASVFRGVISGGGRQTLYYGLKSSFLAPDNASGAARVVLGMASGVFAAGLAAPVDLVRTRQQGELRAGQGASVIAVLRRVYSEEGGLRGLYRGSSAVFMRQALLTGSQVRSSVTRGANTPGASGRTALRPSQLASYDRAKVAVNEWTCLPSDALATQAAAAAIAGGIATVSIAPVEFVKTKMQATGSKGGFVSVARCAVHEEGMLALWRGSGALWAKLAPHTLIVLLTTDAFRAAMGVPIIL